MEYFLEIKGESKGPYSRLEVQNMINNKIIRSNNRIWCSDYEDWIPLSESDFTIDSNINYEGNNMQVDSNLFFFNFFKPYLNYIDNGDFFRKPFYWLYTIIAIIQLLIPFATFFTAMRLDIFKADGEVVFGFIVLWLIIAIAGWLSFQIWWDRRAKITFQEEFAATLVLSHLIRTLGEWLGTYIAVVGFFFTLIILIFGHGEGAYILMSVLPFDYFMGATAWSLVISPLTGFFIIVLSKSISEYTNVLFAIANNIENLKSLRE